MFENERGRNQMALIEDPLTRKGCEYWLERVLGFYGEDGGVDVEVIDDQVALNATTAEYLYTDYTPLELRYEKGSRPMLEAVVAGHVADGMSDRDKALALMRRVRDNRDAGLGRADLFNGGTEEELLKRGAIMCNEVSRLYACLCQIAGLPARLYCAHISGHMMSEVYVDGKWAWVDSMKGIFPVGDDGGPISAWEIHLDPTVFERQPKSVWDEVRPPHVHFGSEERDSRNVARDMIRNRDCYFHPREAMAIGNYFVWEHERYTYPWRIAPADPERLQAARIAEARNRREAGWPDYYFHPHLANDEIGWR